MDKKYLAQFIKPIKESLLNSGFTIEVIIENVAVDELPLVRIVLDSSESNDCFRVYGLACDIYMPNSDHFRNFISFPPETGCPSLHAAVVGPEGQMVGMRIHIREMLNRAEKHAMDGQP